MGPAKTVLKVEAENAFGFTKETRAATKQKVFVSAEDQWKKLFMIQRLKILISTGNLVV